MTKKQFQIIQTLKLIGAAAAVGIGAFLFGSERYEAGKIRGGYLIRSLSRDAIEDYDEKINEYMHHDDSEDEEEK